MRLKKVYSALLVAVLTCSLAVLPVFATPESENADSLKQQKETKTNEMKELQEKMNTLANKMNELELQLIEKGQQIMQAEEDLVAAKEKEEQQYEDLKLRIKYMYEEGEGTALDKILSSGSIAEVLTTAEYVQKVHSYDRQQLKVYQQTVQEVKDLKASLENDQKKLQSLESEYNQEQTELQSMIDSKSAEIDTLDAMIQEAARIAAEKAAEEAARRAAEEAARREEQNNYIPPSNNVTIPPDDGTIVGRAYSWVGKAEYVWGGCAPGAFDCSGFVSYCLTGRYQRLGTTWTFLGWPRVSDPQPGDVCVNSGHCGIYIGGGQMIHAATYGVGVIVGPVQSGMVYVRY